MEDVSGWSVTLVLKVPGKQSDLSTLRLLEDPLDLWKLFSPWESLHGGLDVGKAYDDCE